MDEIRFIAKGTAWTFLLLTLTKLFSFFYLVIITRAISPDDIGAFYFVLSVLGLLFIFTDFGLGYSLSRYLPYFLAKNQIGKARTLTKICYFIGVAVTFIFFLGVFFLAEELANVFSQPALEYVFQITSAWLLFEEIRILSSGFLVGMKQIKNAQVLDSITMGVRLVFTMLFIYFIGSDINAMIFPFLIGTLIAAVFGLYFVSREMEKLKEGKEEKISKSVGLIKEVVSFGVVLTVVYLLWSVVLSIDRVMIGYLMENSLENVAVYTVATTIGTLVILFPTSILYPFFPIISELYGKEKKQEMRRTCEYSTKLVTMTAIPLLILMMVFPDDVLRLLYGGFYEKGAVVLTIFSVGMFIRALSSVHTTTIAAMRRLDIELKVAGGAMIINVILNLILIPLWGIEGAAIASAISLTFATVFFFYYTKKLIGFSIPINIYKPIIAGAITLIVILMLKDFVVGLASDIGFAESETNMIIQSSRKLIIFGSFLLSIFIVYVACLLALKTFDAEEKEIIKGGLRKINLPPLVSSFVERLLE